MNLDWLWSHGLHQAVVIGLLALALAFLLGKLRLFGPLLLFDLVRDTRRNRYVLFRLYLYFIILIAAGLYVIWSNHPDAKLDFRADEAAQIAERFFLFFMSAQLFLMVLIVPGYTASAIADEKDRRTLEFLLATDLRNREIVLSKFTVRVAMIVLMLLTGVPILSLMFLLGGIDPGMLLVSYAATLLTVIGLAALSILNSTYARRSRDAIFLTYIQLAAYLLLSILGHFFLPPALAGIGLYVGDWGLSIGDVEAWFSAGNPLLAVIRLIQSAAWGGRIHFLLLELLRDYAIFQAVFTVFCIAWASWRLRAVFVRQTYGESARTRRLRGWLRPQIGTWPMLWKEVVAEPGLRFNWAGKLALLALVACSFAPAFIIEAKRGVIQASNLSQAFGVWTRVTGTFVACFLLIGVAVRASSTLSGERDKHTLDSLLTTTLSASSILAGKLAGSILSVRLGMLWLGVIWLVGMMTSEVHPLALPVFAMAWTIYAVLLAIAGMWFSLYCQTSLRALVCTLFTTLFLACGFLVLPLYYAPNVRVGPGYTWSDWMAHFQMGLAPPLVLGRLLPFWKNDGLLSSAFKDDWELQFAYLGLGCWILAVLAWGWMVYWYFCRVAGRRELVRQEIPAEAVVAPSPAMEQASA